MLGFAILAHVRLPPWPAVTCYLLAAGVLVAGYLTDQSTCIWRALTGIPCPSCGMIHAFLALGRGDLSAAWNYNHASFATAPILLWVGIGRLKEMLR
ncbi:MAG: DUF2752 domain-containing protein [Vicinamibacterales bacterium]